MYDQVEIVELCAARLKEVSGKTLSGALKNGCELRQCDGCRPIEHSGRAAAEDNLLDRIVRLIFFLGRRQANYLADRSWRWEDRLLSPPLSYFDSNQ
jgi:hypothetical protein